MSVRRSAIGATLTGLAVVVALVSAGRSAPHVWRSLGAEQRLYAHSTRTEDRVAFLTALSVDSQAFDFYAAHLHRGDRFFFQVPTATETDFALLGSAIAAATFYLLPAVRTTDVDEATVVLSYDVDPSALDIPSLRTVPDGSRPFYVSRISRP